jgi:hypothetical protein
MPVLTGVCELELCGSNTVPSAITMPGTSILNEYHAKRKELVDKDVSLRQDRAKYTSMSDVERAAEEIMRRIRKEEALRVWSHEQDLFPGMAFLTGQCLNVYRYLPPTEKI